MHQLFRMLYALVSLDTVNIYWWWCISLCRVLYPREGGQEEEQQSEKAHRSTFYDSNTNNTNNNDSCKHIVDANSINTHLT